MFSELLSTIKTIADRDQLLSELTVLRNSQFQNQSDLELLLRTTVAFCRRNAFLQLIKDHDTFKKKSPELFKQVHSLKVVEITVAYGFTDAVIDKIYHFLTESIGYQIILKLMVNQRILGGAVVSFEGKYGDFSVEKKLAVYFKEHKEDIVKKLTAKL